MSFHCIHAFNGTNYEYWKARMCFFLKSIDVWQIVETGWIKPEATTPNYLLLKIVHDFPMIKPSMLYVKRFPYLNSQEFQIVNLLKKHGKS
jgi:hypothetical protein